MGEWIDMDRWVDCASMERPGIIFEVVNADGQSVFTPCVAEVPVPFDWTSQPIKFRPIEEPEPRHSDPLPLPIGKR
jgi:hypothetical protein